MRVLVLCHGNINRSPFVAALVARECPAWDVVSAGLHTRDGRRASRKAREAAERRDLDLSEHRSVRVTLRALQDAHVVLYMDGGNWRRLLELIETAPKDQHWDLVRKCRALYEGTPYRRVPDPAYTSDPETLADMFGVAEQCTRHTITVLAG